MPSKIQAQARAQKIAGVILFGIIILIKVIANHWMSVFPDWVNWILFPGDIADMLLSGNAHAGFGLWLLDGGVESFGAWLFWMLPVCLIIWAFSSTKRANK